MPQDDYGFFRDEPDMDLQEEPAATISPAQERLAWAQKELDRIDRRLRELRMTADRVKEESERLGQQSASIIAYLKQAVRRGHTQDVLKGYETALETQKRHLLMRGQVEGLENQRKTLEMYRELLVQYIEALEQVADWGEQQARRDGPTPASVELVKMVIEAEERVRRRLARQVHDGPAQALANFILQADIAYRLFESSPEEAGKELDNLRRAANTTFQQVRAFITELRPLTLDDLGLVAAVQRYLQMVEKRHDARTQLQVQGTPPKLARYLQMLIFRAVQEAVTRAVTYGHASQVEVVLDFQPRQIFLRVQADSKRWAQEEASTEEIQEADEALRLLREQVEILGGSLTVEPLEAGEGEFVEFLIPVTQEEE
ncbi:MAG: hypothetical protein GXO37_07410 [Chloroflexi bacterium]|nr:hypothetical protein [Chloroflexota bacterium]